MSETYERAFQTATFENRVTSARNLRGWSIRDLANEVAKQRGRDSLSINYIRSVINGHAHGRAYEETLEAIKRVLGI
ncbi:hypothetical protein X291_01640 [Oenococcus oeni IOEB_C23]|uniref:hypothetical protein n=1 Tax=Oenococcus oeni TaxID=1247 RepID=UPI00050FD456|nr:hypothetical protein [Oenococcus oeni]KGH67067.1 hypothetical protein X291_01640 [Oenococcus oeni IOEB_C23]